MPRQVTLRSLVSSTPGRRCPLAVLTGSDPGSSRNPLLSIQLVTLLCLGSQFSSWQLYPFNSHLPLLKIFCGLKMFLWNNFISPKSPVQFLNATHTWCLRSTGSRIPQTWGQVVVLPSPTPGWVSSPLSLSFHLRNGNDFISLPHRGVKAPWDGTGQVPGSDPALCDPSVDLSTITTITNTWWRLLLRGKWMIT